MRRILSLFLRDLRRAIVRAAWLLAVFLCLAGGESNGAVALWERDLAVARASTPPWEPVPLDL